MDWTDGSHLIGTKRWIFDVRRLWDPTLLANPLN
jgi:hypothetical protein